MSFQVTAAMAILFVSLYTLYVRTRSAVRYLPGPKPELIFGNARQVPKTMQWLRFAEWSEQYGGLIFFKVFHLPYLVINDGQLCLDLLDKRSNIYSDRPRNTMAKELMGWGFTTLMKPYGDVWRQHRKMIHQSLNVRDLDRNRRLQVQAAHTFLRRLGENPSHFLDQIKHLAGSVILKVAYGYELSPSDNYYVAVVEHAVEGLTATFGVGYLVDFIPILKYVPTWMPGAKFQRLASNWHESATNMANIPWDEMMERYTNGTAPISYCSKMLDANGGTSCEAQTKLLIKETAASLYAAGADSASSVISSFILAMTLHPEIFAEAQAEMDAVLGRQRLPTVADRNKLPFLECIMKEVYRWNPAAPIGAAHRLMQDDFYDGCLIPKGTTIITNIWAMTHNKKVYPDPTAFNPRRFAGVDPAPDPRTFAFGFGRRRCIGEVFADSLVYITLASVISCFNIERSIVDGKEVVPRVSYPFFVGHPSPFETQITLRDGVAGGLIDAAVELEAGDQQYL